MCSYIIDCTCFSKQRMARALRKPANGQPMLDPQSGQAGSCDVRLDRALLGSWAELGTEASEPGPQASGLSLGPRISLSDVRLGGCLMIILSLG
jgi:hypothetical protein